MNCEELMLTNRAGKRMPATLYAPDAPQGTALVLHGVGGWKGQPVITATAHVLAEHGYAVLAFDAADGPVAPDNDFFNSTITGYLDDIEDVIAWMKQQPWYREPLILAGHSVGALAALRHANAHRDATKLLLIAPAISWKSGWWMQGPYLLWWLVVGSRPTWNPFGQFKKLKPLGRRWLLDFLAYDGYQDARTCSIPSLVISASQDGTVAKPFEHRRFARAFGDCQQAVIAGADHDFRGYEDELAATIRQWLLSS